jgi:hypothetical protein
MNDSDFWEFADVDDLWLFDKLILSKKLGYNCGPAGVVPKEEGRYIVRPCVNYRMMAKGARFMHLNNKNDFISDGFFWCEIFTGRHLSFDFHYGKQVLAVEGFRENEDLSRFMYWKRVTDEFQLPDFLKPISTKYEWLNVEVIGDKIIEVHLRYDDSFHGHDYNIIVPIWKEENIDKSKKYYINACEERLGFYLIK